MKNKSKVWALVMLVAFSSSCYSKKPDQDLSQSFAADAEYLFNTANLMQLKYRPVYRLGPRPPTGEDILKYWIYSVSENCVRSCEKHAKSLHSYLNSGVATAEECPLPYFAVLEFISLKDSFEKRIFIHASGHCFTYEGRSFVTEAAFTDYVENNVISVFRSDLVQPDN